MLWSESQTGCPWSWPRVSLSIYPQLSCACFLWPSAELCRSRSKPTVDAQALNADAAAPAARPDGIFVDCGRGKAANPKSSVQPYQARHVCEEDDSSPACLHDFSSSR
eukprot:scaffold12218_cov77-Phaeocystis_antarctica.AAC.1